MTNIKIENVYHENVYQLQKIGKQTFLESFAQNNTEENMTSYIDESFSLSKLTAEINNHNSEFYFAIFNNQVIGYLKLNLGKSQTELLDKKALEIERIYVLKDFQGKGIGQLLFEKALQIAEQRCAAYIWLGVWEENPRAISFYHKNGFVAFDKHIFKLGNDLQTDIMMKLMLN